MTWSRQIRLAPFFMPDAVNDIPESVGSDAAVACTGSAAIGASASSGLSEDLRDVPPEAWVGQGHPGSLAALHSGDDGAGVHAGDSRERPGCGRIPGQQITRAPGKRCTTDFRQVRTGR